MPKILDIVGAVRTKILRFQISCLIFGYVVQNEKLNRILPGTKIFQYHNVIKARSRFLRNSIEKLCSAHIIGGLGIGIDGIDHFFRIFQN